MSFCSKFIRVIGELTIIFNIQRFGKVIAKVKLCSFFASQCNCNPACTDLLMNSDHKPNQKLVQSDLVYWVYRSCCSSSCAASWASEPMGCLYIITTTTTIIIIIIQLFSQHCFVRPYTVLTLITAVYAVVLSIQHPGHQNAPVVTTREERLSTRVDYCNSSTPNDITHQFIKRV